MLSYGQRFYSDLLSGEAEMVFWAVLEWFSIHVSDALYCNHNIYIGVSMYKSHSEPENKKKVQTKKTRQIK